MRKAPYLLTVFLFLFTSLVTGAGASAQKPPVVLRYPIAVDPEHLNPFTATTIAIATVTSTIYEGLIAVDPKTGEPLPWLAERWTVSDNQQTYTFYLRKGVLFHNAPGVKYDNDDREFKADDWIWAAKLSLGKDQAVSTHVEWLEGVVGAEEFKAGKAPDVKGIVALDNYTIQITLNAPNRLFLTTLGVPAVPREAYEQLGEKFATTPVGTGPFQFVEWQRDNFLLVKANPDYWRKSYPKVDAIRFINIPDANTALLQYRQHELDFLFNFPTGQRTALIREFAPEYVEKPGLNVRYFGFKMNQGFFAEHALVRKAFAHAFNRELVWNELMEKARFPGTQGVLPPGMPASTPATSYTYDMKQAADLLAQAGFPNGNGMPEISLYVFASARNELSFPVLQEDLRQLGVKLKIVVEEDATYWSHIGKDDVLFFLSGWSAGTPDPSNILNFKFYEGRDDTKYNNPKVNDLLKLAQRETDLKARTQSYQQAHDLIMDDAPWIVSAYSKVSWLQKRWVQGFEPGSGGTYTAKLGEVSIDPAQKP